MTALLIGCESAGEKSQTSEEQLEKVRREQVSPWGIELVGYQTSTSDTPVKVAVLDSGIYKKHEDLQGKVVKEYNAINPDQPVEDDYGHGTAVAGIITANDNDVGIIGVTQDVELYDVKVLNSKGKGSVEDLISAIEWCMAEQVDIINISFGFQSENEDLKRVIEKASSDGIIIVAAAGNTYGLGVDYPARHEQVYSITAINDDLTRPSSAARGKIDYVAPGVSIISTDAKGGYALFDGTSFATAYSTGVLAELSKEYKEIENGSKNNFSNFIQLHVKRLKQNENEFGNGILILN
jgi:minor extracellular protease Epr